jgi:hypothetical protein
MPRNGSMHKQLHTLGEWNAMLNLQLTQNNYGRNFLPWLGILRLVSQSPDSSNLVVACDKSETALGIKQESTVLMCAGACSHDTR